MIVETLYNRTTIFGLIAHTKYIYIHTIKRVFFKHSDACNI